MFNKRALEISTTTIIVAVIALIVLVVLIGVFTGRLNIYSSGVNELTTCENTCINIGYDGSDDLPKGDCKKNNGDKGRLIPGTFGDVGKDNECCCLQKK